MGDKATEAALYRKGKAITSIKGQGKTYLSQKRRKDTAEPHEIEVIAGTLDGRLAIWY